MSFEGFGGLENQTSVESNDLSDVDVSGIEEDYIKVHEIQAMELADNEDNRVTIPSDLQDFFGEEFNESDELLSKVEELKSKLYENLALNNDLEKNTDIGKFQKGFVDGLIIENVELIDNLLEKGIDELVTMINALADWEVIKAIAKDIIGSMGDILNTFQKPYEGGLALGGFGLGVIGKSMKGLKIADKLGDTESLYKQEDYRFLKNYKDILGEDLTINDIVGEGNNALILNHPDKIDKVLKIAKEGNVDKLDIEFNNQYNFEKGLKNLRIKYKGTLEGEILNNFSIPKIQIFGGTEGIYGMEKINGLSLKSIVHIEFNKDKLVNIPDKLYDGLSKEKLIKFLDYNGVGDKQISIFNERGVNDSDIIKFLKEKGLRTYPEGKRYSKERNKPYVEKFIRTWFSNPFYKNEITPFNDILKKEGFHHKDIHWGNYMIGEDGKKYMIDFGNSEIKK